MFIWTCFMPGIVFLVMILVCPEMKWINIVSTFLSKNTSLVIIRVFSSTCDIFIRYGKEGVQSYYQPTDEESWKQRDSFWSPIGTFLLSFIMHCLLSSRTAWISWFTSNILVIHLRLFRCLGQWNSLYKSKYKSDYKIQRFYYTKKYDLNI